MCWYFILLCCVDPYLLYPILSLGFSHYRPTSSHSGNATLIAKKQGSKAEVFSVLYLSLVRMPRQPNPVGLYN